MDDLKVRLGKAIAKKRLAENLEQEDLAREATRVLGKTVTEDQISRWETGKNLIRLDVLLAIAKVLKLSVDELITGEEAFEEKVLKTLDARFGARISRIEKHLGL